MKMFASDLPRQTVKNNFDLNQDFCTLILMRNKLLTMARRGAGWLLAFCFAASLFMCGDADCLTGTDDENCASLWCSLLSKHDAPTPNAASSADKYCSCVCHVPTVVGPIFNFNYHPATQYNTTAGLLQISSAHPRLVYHPPAAI